MNLRAIMAISSVVIVAEASLILPHVSHAQLAETATATSINSGLHTRPMSNVLGASRRAKSLSKLANQQRKEDEEAWNPKAQGGQTQQTSRKVSLETSQEFNENQAVRGKLYNVSGNIVNDGDESGHRVISVIQWISQDKYVIFGVRPKDARLPRFLPDTPVKFTGVYVDKSTDRKFGNTIYALKDGVFEQVVPGNGQTQDGNTKADTPEAEKPTFNSVLKGWNYRGMVQVEGHATGVFVNEDRVKYAQPGTALGEGVRVSQVNDEQAIVIVDGKKVQVSPW